MVELWPFFLSEIGLVVLGQRGWTANLNSHFIKQGKDLSIDPGLGPQFKKLHVCRFNR